MLSLLSFKFILVIFFIFILILLFKLIYVKLISKHSNIESNIYPYISRGKLLTPSELSFYKVLLKALPSDLIAFPKIRQADVLSIKKGVSPSNRQIAFNKISRKHYDFVLCSRKDLSIVGVVELNDSSHTNLDVIIRDEFVHKSLSNAQIPLYSFSARKSYSINNIRNLIS